MPWSSQYFTTIIIEGPTAGIWIYDGTPGSGNLIGSWSAVAGTDQYGNAYPAGIYVNSGTLSGVTVSGGTLLAGTAINMILQGPQITGGSYSGGVVTNTQIIMSNVNGVILGYSTGVTTTTYSTPGQYNHTAVAASAGVSCWGSGAGGGGGSSAVGGESGGGGEWANEPSYPQVIGQEYPVIVPQGGTGGITGQPGGNGSAASYNGNSGVYAHGGIAGVDYLAGAGGTGSVNTNHFDGGNGANAGEMGGGSSGGNSAGSAGAGNDGIGGTGPSGAARPAAQAGTGQGGAGGDDGDNGGSGGAPGAAGGGAGSGSETNQFSKSYQATSSASYYGTDVGGDRRNESSAGNGTLYQGNPDVGEGVYPGNQFSFALFNYNEIISDLNGVTVSDVKVRLSNIHSWYDSGMTAVLGWTDRISYPSSIPSLGSGDNPNVAQFFIGEGDTVTQDIEGYGFVTAILDGDATGLMLGPAQPSNASPSLENYGYFDGAQGSAAANPQLTITGTTGTGSNQGGNGASGQVQVTEQTSAVLVMAVSPAAGTDSDGNSYAAGYTGAVQAFAPASSPAVPETWHNVTPPSGWSGVNRYKLLAEADMVIIDVQLTSSAGGSGNITVMTLPAGYIPATTHDEPLVITSTATSDTLRMGVNDTGAVTTSSLPSGTTTIAGTWVVPLN